jgi:hypothetical protein
VSKRPNRPLHRLAAYVAEVVCAFVTVLYSFYLMYIQSFVTLLSSILWWF